MKNSTLLAQLLQWQQIEAKDCSSKNKAGYTLLELLVVVLIIAILATIAVPGWLGFLSQRKVSAASNLVFQSLQEAQSQAKAKKLSYSVSILAPNGKVPQIAVYQNLSNTDSTPPPANSKLWRSLGQNNIKPGDIWIGTNSSNNDASPGITVAPSTIPTPATATITFDYTGALPPNTTPSPGTNGLIIAVAAAQPNNPSQPILSTGRCSAVRTILGAIQTGRVTGSAAAIGCNFN